MSIPPEPIIRGAQRWLQLIPTAGVQRARTLLASLREYADLSPTQYAESFDWAQRIGLLDRGRELAAPERLLEAAILGGSPAWLPDADLLVHDVTEIPDDALSAARALGVPPSGALACIRRAWGKVDTEMRRYVGERGEEEILRYLITLPGVQIDHVASWSDAYGYDIAVLGAMRECHLEVKSTTRANRLTLHLSRNEFETMKADEAWHLVAVVLDQELRLARVYAIARDWIQSCAPADTALGARWDSAKFDVPQAACTPGIPALAPFLSCEDSPLLVGRTVASSAWSLSAYPDRRLSVYLRWRAQMMQALNAIVRMVGLGELSCCAAIACCCLNRLKNLARTARASPRARRPQHLLRVLERA